MKFDLKKIINIKSLKDLNKYDTENPIYNNNYLFHYLIIFDKLDILKLKNFPIYKENDENMNGFFLSSKYNNLEILQYLIDTYPSYIYNKNLKDETFIDYLNSELIIKIMKYTDNKLNWKLLIKKKKIDELYFNLNYDDILNLTKINCFNTHYLHYIIKNTKLDSEQKIKILDLANNLNIRNNSDESLIFPTIEKKDIIILKYLLSKNVDCNYYTIIYTNHPFKLSIHYNFYDGAILLWEKIKNIFNYELTNCYLENILHFILKRELLITLKDSKLYDIIINIINKCSNLWCNYDVNKVTPLDYISNYDFNKYNYLIKNIKINSNFTYSNIEPNNKWLNYIKSLPKYTENINIILQNNKYTHTNLFQSRFKDMSLYLLYLKDKYINLYYPNFNDFQLNNFGDLNEINIDWPDSMLENHNYPWLICYESSEDYFIHSQLNNLINSQRRIQKYDFAFCYLSLKTNDDGLHANIIIYDFNNFTIERFDPYGDTVKYDNNLDEILEEELSWNTGFKYLKPSNYMPVAGFQTVSDELNPYKQKSGDFGGYCLAWCIWYLEHRILNKNIKPEELVVKIIKKLSSPPINENTFMEYIRNYANKLNESRIIHLKNIGLDIKTITNLNFPRHVDNSINRYINTTFK
jgi:hypothetical protein